jgi:hypothetical protein
MSFENDTLKGCNTRDSEVLVQPSRTDKLLDSQLVFAQSGIYKTHIRQDLGRVRDTLSNRSQW